MLPLQFQAGFSQICSFFFSYDQVSSCTSAALKAIYKSWKCESTFSTEDCVDQQFTLLCRLVIYTVFHLLQEEKSVK